MQNVEKNRQNVVFLTVLCSERIAHEKCLFGEEEYKPNCAIPKNQNIAQNRLTAHTLKTNKTEERLACLLFEWSAVQAEHLSEAL